MKKKFTHTTKRARMDKLGKRLADVRRRQGLTQEQLARISGVSRVQIAHVETGRGSISIWSLRALARALGISIDYLVATFEDDDPD